MREKVAKIIRGIVGRKIMVRVGRFLSNWGRLDVPNDMHTNGELLLLRSFVSVADRRQHHIFVDAGANVGDWALALLDICAEYHLHSFSLHCFEPHPVTFDTLSRRVKAHALGGRVRLFQQALSDDDANAALFIVGDNAGTNSLHPIRAAMQSLTIQTVSLESHAERHDIQSILYMKVDTEGHDMRVLKGASRLLREGRIVALQFEYNFRWILSRCFLKDVFDLDLDGRYRIGKVTPGGFESYTAWHPELESFREGNYMLCQAEHLASLPHVDWWLNV